MKKNPAHFIIKIQNGRQQVKMDREKMQNCIFANNTL